MTALLTHARRVEDLISGEEKIYSCVCVCVWPSRSFKRGTLEVFFPGHVVSICQQLLWYFLPVFHPKKKKLSLFIELTERRVGGQRYFIIALELEKSVTG